MILVLIQLLTTLFSAYIFLPVFVDANLGGVFRLIAFAPFGIGALIIALVISLFRLFISFLLGRKFSLIFNLIMLLINVITGIVILI